MPDYLTLLAGAFVLMVGTVCLPRDMARPWGGGITGVPVDAALIVLGAIMVVDSGLPGI